MDTQAIKAITVRAAVLLILSSTLTTSGTTHADVITFWNEALLEAVRNEPQGPLKASRAMAMVHAAMYDAVNSVDRKYYPYHAQLEAAFSTSKEAAGVFRTFDSFSAASEENGLSESISGFTGASTTPLG